MVRTKKSTASSNSVSNNKTTSYEIKEKLSETQLKTIEKNSKEVFADETLLKNCLECIEQFNLSEITSSKKTMVYTAYLLVREFWKKSKKAFVGFQNDSSDKIINNLKSDTFKDVLPEALEVCKHDILRDLLKRADSWVKIAEFNSFIEGEVEIGDEVFIYHPFGKGFGMVAKAIVEKIEDQQVTTKKLNYLHDFYKEQLKEIPLSLIRIKTKAKDLKPSRNSFTAINRGTLTLSTEASSSTVSPNRKSSNNSSSDTQSSSNEDNSNSHLNTDSEPLVQFSSQKSTSKPKSSTKNASSSNEPSNKKASSSNDSNHLQILHF